MAFFHNIIHTDLKIKNITSALHVLGTFAVKVQPQKPNAQRGMPLKWMWGAYLSGNCIIIKAENKKKNIMRGIIFTTGTKDKTEPSTRAKTICQLKIRSSRQVCLRKPFSLAPLTSCSVLPRQKKNVVTV